MPKIMLNYRSNERRRLVRPLNRLLNEVETSLSWPNSWRIRIMMKNLKRTIKKSVWNLGFFPPNQLPPRKNCFLFDNSWASQNITQTNCARKVQKFSHNVLNLSPILRKMNPMHALQSCFFNTPFNIIFPSTHMSFKLYRLFIFPHYCRESFLYSLMCHSLCRA
jgi:hypothetical protein